MNRKSFMAELRSLLAFLDAAERERVLNRYERMFEEAGTEGEAAVIRCFGSPVRQVLQIEREYREAVANGETPFADGELPPEEPAAPAEETLEDTDEPYENEAGEDEAYADEPYGDEPEEVPEAPEASAGPEMLPESEETFTEIIEEVPEEEITAAEPFASVLPELDLDSLDLASLDLTLPEEYAPAAGEEPLEETATVKEIVAEDTTPEEGESLPEEPAGEEPQPEAAAEEPSSEPVWESADESADVSSADEEPETPENAPESVEALPDDATAPGEETAAAAEEPSEPEEQEEPEPETAEPPEEPYPGETYEEETEKIYEYEEAEPRRPVSGARAFGAVLVTIPMLVLWAVLFGLSLGLGLAVLAIGAALCMAGVYLAGYVFGSAITYMPDLLLTAGAALAAFALALLLLWSGVSIAISGCSLTVRLTRRIYRSILYPNREENSNE